MRAYDEICNSIATEICDMYPEDFSLEILMEIILNAFQMNKLNTDEQLKEVGKELYDKLIGVVNSDRWKVAHELVFQFLTRILHHRCSA